MKRATILFSTISIFAGIPLCAQDVVFQQAGAIGKPVAVESGQFGSFATVASSQMIMRAVTGSPFTGTEERHSLQVLGDGTRIERTENTLVSRDSQGRTRRDSTDNGQTKGVINIQDPVAGADYVLDPMRKIATKLPRPKITSVPMQPPPGVAGAQVRISAANGVASAGVLSARIDPSDTVAVSVTGPISMGKPAEEDLGTQNINGVLAKGSRTTIEIPVGQIGNDRAIQVVSERWYSDELQMVVKSSNSDPRFGTTTFELTNVSRAEPDSSLFQIPSDYTVREGGGPLFAPK